MPIPKAAVEALASEHVSAVTTCGAADLDARWAGRTAWYSTFIRTAAAGGYRVGNRGFCLLILRRVSGAIDAYVAARGHVLELVEEKRWSSYFRALTQYEISIALLYQAIVACTKLAGERLFDRQDGSPEQRLNQIYNVYRHDPVLEADDQPLWVTDTAISCASASIAFREYEEILEVLAHYAQALAQGDTSRFLALGDRD